MAGNKSHPGRRGHRHAHQTLCLPPPTPRTRKRGVTVRQQLEQAAIGSYIQVTHKDGRSTTGRLLEKWASGCVLKPIGRNVPLIAMLDCLTMLTVVRLDVRDLRVLQLQQGELQEEPL